MSKKIEVVIKRSKWRTGYEGENKTGRGDTQLLNKQGFKCCLGFICLTVRPKTSKVSGLHNPFQCDFPVQDLKCGIYDTYLTTDAITINDDESTTQKQKEIALKKLFKYSCYKLKFVD